MTGLAGERLDERLLGATMNRTERLIAAIIPLLCIAFFLLYFQQTRDYDEFVSVQFPYTISLLGLFMFSIIAILELRKFRQALSEKSRNTLKENLFTRLPPVGDKKWNPFYVVVLTVIFTALFPVIKSISSIYLYIFGLRLVFKETRVRTFVLDLVFVIVLFVIFHDLLRILLPSGPIEKAISSFVRSVF